MLRLTEYKHAAVFYSIVESSQRIWVNDLALMQGTPRMNGPQFNFNLLIIHTSKEFLDSLNHFTLQRLIHMTVAR